QSKTLDCRNHRNGSLRWRYVWVRTQDACWCDGGCMLVRRRLLAGAMRDRFWFDTVILGRRDLDRLLVRTCILADGKQYESPLPVFRRRGRRQLDRTSAPARIPGRTSKKRRRTSKDPASHLQASTVAPARIPRRTSSIHQGL